MVFAVEKGIPRIKPTGTGLTKYPFGEMAVGDSFFVRCASADVLKVKNRIRSATRVFRRRHIKTAHFEVRSVSGGARCWRIS